MDLSDVVFSSDLSLATRIAFLSYADSVNASPYTKILTPTETNDDVNGSQHALHGGNDFTYRDATLTDVENTTTLGFYEYFSDYFGDSYTGHYYQGSDHKFEAIVVNPPAYAADYTI